MPPAYNQNFAFANGVDPGESWGQYDTITVVETPDGTPWTVDTWWSILMTTTNGDYTFGKGNMYPWLYRCLLSYGNRVLLGNGSRMNVSDVADPTGWEEQNGQAGYINLTSHYGTQDVITGMVPYQGRVAVFARHQIQIWQVATSLANFAQQQTLGNIGSDAVESIKNVGELDVIFLSDSGIRSLQARETTLNAFVTDLGSPIDSLVQDKLAECSDEERQTASAIVEPVGNRYQLFLKDVAYVLSRFPQNKISAWSTYDYKAVKNGALAAFTTKKQLVYAGVVYIRGEDGWIYKFSDTFDASEAVAELPWLDCGKPATEKRFESVDIACAGEWKVEYKFHPDQEWMLAAVLGNDTAPDEVVDSTFYYRRIPMVGTSNHVKIRIVSQGDTGKAILSSVIIHYDTQTAD